MCGGLGKGPPDAAAAPVPGTDSGGELPCGKRKARGGPSAGPLAQSARGHIFFKVPRKIIRRKINKNQKNMK